MQKKFEFYTRGHYLSLVWTQEIPNQWFSLLLNYLQENPQVTHLDLQYALLGCAEAQQLAAFLKGKHSLSWINLDNNFIADLGASALAEALKVNSGLHFLSLNHNCITDKGAKEMAFALKFNDALTHLELTGGRSTAATSLAFAQTLQCNDRLGQCKLDKSNPSIDNELLRNRIIQSVWLEKYNVRQFEALKGLLTRLLPTDIARLVYSLIGFIDLTELPAGFFKQQINFYLKTYAELCFMSPVLAGKPKVENHSLKELLKLTQTKPENKNALKALDLLKKNLCKLLNSNVEVQSKTEALLPAVCKF